MELKPCSQFPMQDRVKVESGKSSVAGRTLNAGITRLWCEADPLCLRLVSKPVGGLDEGIERVQSGP